MGSDQKHKPENMDNQENPVTKKRFFTKKRITLLVSAVIAGLFVWDWIDAPPFWHFRQADRNAIVSYQREHYPGARVVKTYFPFFGNPYLIGPPVNSNMQFEYDGVTFGISAKDGKIEGDGFPYAKETQKIKEIIVGEFMNSRGLLEESDAHIEAYFQMPGFIYPEDDKSLYCRPVNISIDVPEVFGSPQEVGWLYDCYQYWISRCSYPEFSIRFHIKSADAEKTFWAVFVEDSEINSEEDFYSGFVYS